MASVQSKSLSGWLRGLRSESLSILNICFYLLIGFYFFDLEQYWFCHALQHILQILWPALTFIKPFTSLCVSECGNLWKIVSRLGPN